MISHRALVVLLLLVASQATSTLARRSRSRNRASDPEGADGISNRRGKFYSLFNVVQFNNEGCTSQLASSAVAQTNTKNPTNTGNRRGVCYSAEECSNNGGRAEGSCAAGFGVCCVFIATSGTVTQNCTYIQNTNFPAALTGTNPTAANFQVRKCNNEVCSLRLDFDTFTTLGPANTLEVNGGACQDTFTATAPGITSFPTICGQNTGQHIYIDLGQDPNALANLDFAFSGDGNRMFDIKVTQVECGVNNAPPGCLQYFTSTSGTFQTFNFMDSTSNHLANQMYRACFRQARGFCCIQYTVCPGVADAFSLNEFITTNDQGLIDSQCVADYLQITGGSATCNSAINANQVSKICGTAFTVNNVGTTVDIPICDCSEPFEIGVVTNAAADNAKLGQMSQSRGVCLCYTQLPCT